MLVNYVKDMTSFGDDEAPVTITEQWLFTNPAPLYVPAMTGSQLNKLEEYGIKSKSPNQPAVLQLLQKLELPGTY